MVTYRLVSFFGRDEYWSIRYQHSVPLNVPYFMN
jgi:hypothetical protein